MWRFLSFVMLSVISFGLYADPVPTTIVEKQVVISPAPEGVCRTIAGHWEGNLWVETHQICKYANRTEGVEWVNNYWSCTSATMEGTCNNWVFVPGHWVAK